MSSFVIGFILGGTLTAIIGSGFLWGMMTILQREKKPSVDALLASNKDANRIAELRLKQQETIATQLEEIAHNMISGYAKVQQT